MIKFIIKNLKNSFTKSFDYKSRATRSEFWTFQGFYICLSIIPILIVLFLEIIYVDQGKSLFVDLEALSTKAIKEGWSLKEVENQYISEIEREMEYYETILFFILIPMIIPWISLVVRRLHDFGKSGYYIILIFIIPFFLIFYNEYYPNTNEFTFLYFLYLILFYIYISQKSHKGKNKFGAVPKKLY